MPTVKWKVLLTASESHLERQDRLRLASRIARGILEHELTPRQRQILLLHYQEQKTITEIARQLGLSVSSVSRTHRRACETIRKHLKSYHLYE